MDLRFKNERFLKRRSIFQIHFGRYDRILGANLTARDVLIPNLACGYHQEMIFSALESQTNVFYKLRHKIKWGAEMGAGIKDAKLGILHEKESKSHPNWYYRHYK